MSKVGLSQRHGGKQRLQRSDLLAPQGSRKVRKAKRRTVGVLLSGRVKSLLACTCLFRGMAKVRGMAPVRGMAQVARCQCDHFNSGVRTAILSELRSSMIFVR
jgi:hypothetical protein